jgi:hypothetical protein
LLADWTQRQVGFAPETPLFHVAVTDLEIHEDIAKASQVGDDLVGRSHIRFGHNLQQRRAGTIEVDDADACSRAMDILTGILFQVGTSNPHALVRLSGRDINPAMFADRRLVLGNLIAFREIGIEVMLPRKSVVLADPAIQGKTRPDSHLDRSPVDDRKAAWESEADGAGLTVGRQAEHRPTSAKHLRLRSQLGMDLDTDDDFIAGLTSTLENHRSSIFL